MKKLFEIRGKLSPRVDFTIGIAFLAVLIVIWCVLTYGKMVRPVFLPSPTDIFDGFKDFQRNDWIIPAILKSTIRVCMGLVLVVLIGVPVGILMGSIPFFDAMLRKLVNGGKSVPTTGLVGLVVLWFSVDEKAKIVFLFIGAIFYIIVLCRQAIQSVSEDYVKVALDLGATRFQLIRRVLLPGALPQIWDAIAVCCGIMWTYIVLAEYINSSEEQIGLGFLLLIGSRTQDSGKVYLTLIIVAIISAVTDWLFGIVKRRFFFW